MIIDAKPAEDVLEFLEHSNLIEGVSDSDSLEQAFEAWEYLVTHKKLTHGVILKTHKILMLHHLVGIRKGYYRSEDVGIYKKGKLLSKCMDHRIIRTEMDKWILAANSAMTTVYPEEWARQSHIQFEHIHPFFDGNGRIGRMLLNWQRLQAKLPILIIREDERQEYYSWFRSA